MNEFDILCKCGHLEGEHIYGENHDLCGDCLIVEDLDFEGIIAAQEHHFIPDNLGTIEKLAKEKGLI